MRRSLIVSLIAAVFVALVAAGGVAVASTPRVVPTKVVTITSSGCPGGNSFCFKPASLIVKRSTKVVWKNTTGAPHTVTRCSLAACGVSGGTGTDPKFRSPTINPGRTFTFTFHHAGTYRYYCKVHGYGAMHGTITVR